MFHRGGQGNKRAHRYLSCPSIARLTDTVADATFFFFALCSDLCQRPILNVVSRWASFLPEQKS